MLGKEIKRILLSPIAIVSIVLLAVLQLAGIWDTIIDSGKQNWVYLLYMTENFGAIAWAEAVICPLAVACIYYDDWKANYASLAMTRAGRKKYYVIKITATCISSMLIFQFAAILMFLAATIITNGRYSPFQPAENALLYTCWQPFLDAYMEWIVLCILFVIYSMTAAIYGLISLCMSVFCQNRYVILAMPFIVNQMMEFFKSLLPFPAPSGCRLVATVSAEWGDWKMAVVNSVMFHLIYWVILGIVYIYEMRWRSVHG